jgi:CRISPR type III-A-associated RAMP protein Csm4
VDRVTRIGREVNSLACVEFEPGSGLWTVARFQDAAAESAWDERLRAAFRLLADSGFGGGRSKGWGQTQPAEFQAGAWPALLLPKVGRAQRNGAETASEAATSLYWMLSLYTPSSTDKIDWTGGDYRLTVRSGRVDSAAASGAVKKTVRMVTEGAVLTAAAEPLGAAVDVAPDGFGHAVYRSGLALALKLPPAQISVEEERPVEEPAAVEAIEPPPSDEPTASEEPGYEI